LSLPLNSGRGHGRLIVNADDYGMTPGVSAGIREAHRRGIVTSTSVLVVSPHADRELRAARRHCPDLGIGVHLTLTGGWHPMVAAERVRTLVTRRRRLPSSTSLDRVIAAADPDDVLVEWRAQIQAVIDAGVQPDHLDSHHHIADRTEPLRTILLALAREFGLPVRALRDHRPAEGAVTSPDELLSLSGHRRSVAGLLGQLEALRPGTVAELHCHPGQIDLRLRRKSSLLHERERDLALLTDERVIRWVHEHGLELISFKALSGQPSAVGR
jgi:chitin disaccharide deacetylase